MFLKYLRGDNMKKITFQDVEGLQKHDRISVTFLSKSGEEITRNTRYYGIKDGLILVYMPHKQKTAWEIPEGMECIIKKI
jgi:hypothetical protein